jgi:hypothetical protein
MLGALCRRLRRVFTSDVWQFEPRHGSGARSNRRDALLGARWVQAMSPVNLSVCPSTCRAKCSTSKHRRLHASAGVMRALRPRLRLDDERRDRTNGWPMARRWSRSLKHSRRSVALGPVMRCRKLLCCSLPKRPSTRLWMCGRLATRTSDDTGGYEDVGVIGAEEVAWAGRADAGSSKPQRRGAQRRESR